MLLTAAQESDIAQAEALLADHTPEVVIADKGYDKKALVEEIEARGAEAVIPTQKNRKEQREVDPHLYRERNVCERFWAQAKQFRENRLVRQLWSEQRRKNKIEFVIFQLG